VCVCVCVCVRVYRRIFKHARVHTYTRIHANTYTCEYAFVFFHVDAA
jgi:hypothetical protein